MPDIFISHPAKVRPQKRHLLDKRVLSAFRHYPEKAHFLNQVDDEEVVLVLRRHFITNLKWIVLLVLMFFAPLALSLFPILDFMPNRFQFVAVIFWYLVAVAFGFEEFLAWFFNVSLVTNQRIIDVNFSNLIYREISEAELEQVQDVTVRVGSVLRAVFRYGDVLVQTASETQRIAFEAVPDPDRAARILRELREEKEHVNL